MTSAYQFLHDAVPLGAGDARRAMIAPQRNGLHLSRPMWVQFFVSVLFFVGVSSSRAEEIPWESAGTQQQLTLHVRSAQGASPAGERPVVFYLKGLAAQRRGTEDDESILKDFDAAGYLTVLIDFHGNQRARVPFINRDLGRLRDDVREKRILRDWKIDQAHVYIVPAGSRLKRDVVFYRDADRTLAMDVIYPSQPKEPVGALIEFSCDNLNRMGNTSLSICTDTLLDAEATEGFAVAMADHPVAAPYQGLDAMPDSAWKIKAAVRTLRATGKALGLNARIVPVGFSRGSGMALMLVTTQGLPEFEGHGESTSESSAVNGAVVLSGRFTYIDLLPNDKMIARYVKVWGDRNAPGDVWRKQGALDYLSQAPDAPLFLSINAKEGPDALHQMKVLRCRLADLGADDIFLMERELRGHKVPLDESVLAAMNQYLHARMP